MILLGSPIEGSHFQFRVKVRARPLIRPGLHLQQQGGHVSAPAPTGKVLLTALAYTKKVLRKAFSIQSIVLKEMTERIVRRLRALLTDTGNPPRECYRPLRSGKGSKIYPPTDKKVVFEVEGIIHKFLKRFQFPFFLHKILFLRPFLIEYTWLTTIAS